MLGGKGTVPGSVPKVKKLRSTGVMPRNGTNDHSLISRLGDVEAASIMHGVMSQRARVVLFPIMLRG